MMHLHTVLLVAFLYFFLEQDVVQSSKKTAVRRPTYYKYFKIKVPYHYKYKYKKIKWPVTKGRCEVVPDWKINGTNPIREEAAKGRTVLLFLMKRTCEVCYKQLEALHDWAAYYRKTGQPVSIIALNHRRQPLPIKVLRKFPLIKFYEEPVGTDIFGKLRAQWRQIMIFDVCARQQYHFGYPYSWLGYPWTRSGIVNTMNHHVELCGKCKKVPKTTRNPVITHEIKSVNATTFNNDTKVAEVPAVIVNSL